MKRLGARSDFGTPGKPQQTIGRTALRHFFNEESAKFGA